jgi:predicted DNA-binding transcriptional regulator YafY
MRRMSAIVQILNDRIGVKKVTAEQIRRHLYLAYDIECSKSSIEKDLFALKLDFDLPVQVDQGRRGGYYLTERFDFLEALREYLKLY